MKKTCVVVEDGVAVRSIASLQKVVDGLCKKYRSRKVMFRGQPSYAWDLKPSIARMHCFYGKRLNLTETQEQKLLDRFNRVASAYIDKSLSSWELLFQGRHYGLPVRLLDWTSSLLVALYFAVEYKEDKSGACDASLWVCFRNESREPIRPYNANCIVPNKVKGIKLVYPTHGVSRVNAQEGLFSIHENPWESLDAYAKTCPKNNSDIETLIKLKIPANVKQMLLDDLDRFGITERAVYPDLSGAAKSIVTNELLRTR